MSKRKSGRVAEKLKEFWTNNPVLAKGLTIAPVVVATVYLKNAAALSIIMAVVTIPTLFAASVIGRRLAVYHRIPVYVLMSAALFYAGAFAVVKAILPETVDTAGIYLMLMITNTVLLVRAEKYASQVKPGMALLDAVVQVLGYAFVICFVALFREYFGSSTIWGRTVENAFPIAGLTLPFAGFIILGMLCALYNHINIRHKKNQQELKDMIAH